MASRAWFAAAALLAGTDCTHLDSPRASGETAVAQEARETGGEGAPAMTSYVWHDGEREHRVWMNPNLIAEFGREPGGRQTFGQATVMADAQLGDQVVRYWKMEPGMTSDRVLRELKVDRVPGRFSPVLHDSPSTDGPVRVLPGNVVVILDAGWTKQAVAGWVARRELRVVTELPFGPNMLLLETEPGLPALDLANTLYRSGEVKAAFPDWLAQKTVK